jgi:uncharacterized protein (TIGR02444 family)
VTDGRLELDNPFWQFSLSIYGQVDVADECLALQEAAGIDVNVLLFCAWLGARGIVLRKEDIAAASETIEAWSQNVVRPLRGVRQRMKGLYNNEFSDLRERVKALELEAEQVEQAILFAHAKKIHGAEADRGKAISQNVDQYLRTASAPRLIAAVQRRIS